MKTIYDAIEPFIKAIEKLDWDERDGVPAFDEFVVETIGHIPVKGQPFFKEYQNLSDLAKKAEMWADDVANPQNTGFGRTANLEADARASKNLDEAIARLSKEL